MLHGATLLAGDSMTVGLSPFVHIDGAKTTEAAVGRTAAQLLSALQTSNALDGTSHVLVLIGANDIGGGRSIPDLFATVQAIWNLGHLHGARVVAMTLPPAKGWVGFAPNFPAVNQRRKALNHMILASGIPDQVIDLATLMADPGDPDAMAASYDSGDHLHPNKAAMGALLDRELASATPGPSNMVGSGGQAGVQLSLRTLGLVGGGTVALLVAHALYRAHVVKRNFA